MQLILSLAGHSTAKCSTVIEVWVYDFEIKLIFFLVLSMYWLLILSTHSGMVAENMRFWVFYFLWFSTILKISSMSSLNPFSNI